MCYPALIYAAVAAIGAGAGVYSDQQNAKFQTDLSKQNTNNANDAARSEYEARGLRQQQERDAANQKLTVNTLEAVKARSAARVSAGEAGQTGLSVDALINDITVQQSRNADAIEQNRAAAAAQGALENTSTAARARDRANSAQPGYFNPFLGGLQIATAAGSAYYSKK